ncbi:TonB-dependent receptor [Anditalea andensis]|uniref:Ferrichrome-iron receptor n=1 Tax=Anditalea andensis TaxID=1048983 RepID=A0A074LEE7_9BACT|nr:TonB-dependent receptor [Anditalea andensis]KEO72137.1 ferrichrome-iron receptor [Anditalea andensis]
MKIRFTALTIIMEMFLWSAFAQTGSISGIVTTTDGSSVAYANIGIKGSNTGTVTDDKGAFIIFNLSPGTYILFASKIGSVRQEKVVNLAAGENLQINFTLSESTGELDEFTVSDNKINQFYRDSVFIVSKLPLRDLENPQIYNAVPKAVLRDQVATSLSEGLRNATGITRLWESTGRGGDGAEFYSMRGFSVQPSMVNGMPSVNNGGLDPSNIEQIDVIKGPSGTLFGSPMISYGGLINITTKRPFETLGGEIGFINGSNGLNRVTADVNVPVSDNTFARVNTSYHTENSFQDAGYRRSLFFAPSFIHKASDRLTFIVNTEFLSRESANAPMVFLNRNVPLSFDDIAVFKSNYRNAFTSNELSIRNPTFGMQAQALYKISTSWTSQTVLSRSNAKSNGYYHYLWDSGDGDTFGRFISKRNGETNTTDIQQNFIGDFKIGTLRNRMLIGVDYFKSDILNSSTGWVGNGVVSMATGEDTGLLTQAGVNNLLIDSFEGNSNAASEILSAYASDVINFTPYLSAMASVRVDRFKGRTAYGSAEDTFTQTSVSPKFGLVYQPIRDKVSMFANYMNGFSNVEPTEVTDLDGSNARIKIFEPEYANQYEFGIKTNLYQNRISATASYYNILVTNRVMADPENINNMIQGAEVLSRGVEISLIANPIDGLNIIAGFSNNESEVVKDNAESGYLGLRPEEAGPERLINFWGSYTIQTGRLKGLGFGLGGNSASEHKTLHRSNIGSFVLPAYQVFNGTISYKGNQYLIILRGNNLTNQMYFTGWSSINPQNLRNVALSLNYQF